MKARTCEPRICWCYYVEGGFWGRDWVNPAACTIEEAWVGAIITKSGNDFVWVSGRPENKMTGKEPTLFKAQKEAEIYAKEILRRGGA